MTKTIVPEDITTATPSGELDASPNRKFQKITLATPIKRGESEISELTLRKPTAGEMRGLTLQDIIASDVAALITITTRISDPHLIEAEVAGLEVDDFSEIGGAIRGFFMTSGERMMLDEMVARVQGKAT